MATFTLTQEQYEALIALARTGTKDAVALDKFLKSIELANGITRHALWVQWQEQGQPVPPTVRFPETWPPEMRFYIEYISRPIARVDVEAVVAKQARKPTNILVTKDPSATVGWASLDQFFLT